MEAARRQRHPRTVSGAGSPRRADTRRAGPAFARKALKAKRTNGVTSQQPLMHRAAVPISVQRAAQTSTATSDGRRRGKKPSQMSGPGGPARSLADAFRETEIAFVNAPWLFKGMPNNSRVYASTRDACLRAHYSTTHETLPLLIAILS
ncbi:hypothetical protein EVAR_40845_1 [Eumeta japonica]|uniref:Uncharacterized protein n=1 Tax=Eumeta variegata TaxID=151549 RepID=A0A4C1ZQ08_EUMVA|nr:hypothetical protein EVAR_40845_1 [Eumeta japonica]